jgi:hypothetical protein
MTALRWFGASAVLLLLNACGGVSYELHDDVSQPRRIAVLPFGGSAMPGVRDATRQLMKSRLQGRGYHVVDAAWVDCVLTQHGWLHDADTFDPQSLPMADAMAALGCDAVVVGRDFGESRFNILALRRHVVGGRVAITNAAGRDYWSASHDASTFGGFALTSGQVFEELRAQVEHGTPTATLALVDEFVEDVTATIPPHLPAPPPPLPLALRDVQVHKTPSPEGGQRLVVEAHAASGASLRFDLAPNLAGVPMTAVAGDMQHYRGVQDLPADLSFTQVLVHAWDAFGRQTTLEVTL